MTPGYHGEALKLSCYIRVGGSRGRRNRLDSSQVMIYNPYMIDYPPEIEQYMLPTVVILESGCWLWTGGVKSGYGELRKPVNGHSKSLRAHRVFYEAYKGSVPAGMCLDHTCAEKLCVNPEHLEAVTKAENNRRAAARYMQSGSVRRTRICPTQEGDENKFCIRGHPYIGNRREYHKGGTYCVVCNNEAARKYAEKRRAKK